MRVTGNSMPNSKPRLQAGVLHLKLTSMEYTHIKTGDKVEIERWVWGAIYTDGTELKQFAEDGQFHQVGEIDQSKLAMFVMYKPGDPKKRIDMPFGPHMKLVHKYKNVKPFYLDTFVRVYCFGYNIDGYEHRTFILPDDRIIIAPTETIDLPDYELTKN